MSSTEPLAPGELAAPTSEEAELIVLLPVFNDWDAVRMLLPLLDRELERYHLRVKVLLVDDASTEKLKKPFCRGQLRAMESIDVLSLRRNLGHQRALAVGLAYIEANLPSRPVIVMDADGEDDPRDVPRLYQRFREAGGQKVIFAERTRRAESWSFRFFYQLYRVVHWILTGIKVRAGNYSILPFHLLKRLVVASELWNHYAAAVHKIRLPSEMVPTLRARRLTGSSTMNFISLATHGLSAMSVFGERIGVRMLTATITLGCATLLCVVVGLVLSLATDLVLPVWTTYAACVFLAVLLQMLMTSCLFVFIVLHNRDSASIVPIRDYQYYVDRCLQVYAADQPVQVHW